MEAKLLDILKKNMDAFAWSIEDIKGITPSIFMHKIMMEEDYKPTIEHHDEDETHIFLSSFLMNI